MPTYEYHCPKCRGTYELRESFSAETTHKCQECGKGTAKRVLHAPRVVFKGSGFYVTDSKKSGSSVKDTPAETKAGTSESKGSAAETPAPAPAAEAKADKGASTSGGDSTAAAAS